MFEDLLNGLTEQLGQNGVWDGINNSINGAFTGVVNPEPKEPNPINDTSIVSPGNELKDIDDKTMNIPLLITGGLVVWKMLFKNKSGFNKKKFKLKRKGK